MIQAEPDTMVSYLEQDTIEMVVEPPVVSLFENHVLADKNNFTAVDRIEIGSSLGFIILLICTLIIIYIQRNSDGIFSSVFKAGFDSNLANQDARIENSQRTRNLMLLQLVSILSFSLFAAAIFTQYKQTELSSFTVFLWGLAIILNALIIKRILQWILAQIFDLHAELKTFRYSGTVLLSLAGLALLPCSIFLLYSPQIPVGLVIIVGVGLLGFFYLKTLLRGLQISLISSSLSPLYLFYYFCALELLPVFVFVRIAQNL